MAADRCARCGRPINVTSGAWTPTASGELCEWCLTGHEPDWDGRYGPGLPRERFSIRTTALLAAWAIVCNGAVAWLIATHAEDGPPGWLLGLMVAGGPALVMFATRRANRLAVRGGVSR